jgi:DNA modification methylase
MQIEAWPLERLREDPRNARRHPEQNLESIRASLERWGQVVPLVIRPDGTAVGGSGRIRVMKDLGLESAFVVVFDGPENEAIALGLALNRTAELAKWDQPTLRELVSEISIGDAAGDLSKLLQFSKQELGTLIKVSSHTRIVGDTGKATAGDDMTDDDSEDEGDPDPEEGIAGAITKRGDGWLLGQHRLMCGDSTKRAEVKELMGKSRASICFTDPPYGVQYGSASKNAISGDLTQAAIPLSFGVMVEHALDGDARIYLCGGVTNMGMYLGIFDHYLHSQPRVIVWDKEHFVLRQGAYHAQFEFIYWGWRGSGGSPRFWYGDRAQKDLWRVKRDPKNQRIHPTQKPVELAARAIRNHCAESGIVYEPFAGSGSTIMAAEELNRRCYAMELSPRFCDLIVERWQKETGKVAKRVSRA